MMVRGEGRDFSCVFWEGFLLLWLRCKRVGEKKVVAFVQYKEVAVPSDKVEDILRFICVR